MTSHVFNTKVRFKTGPVTNQVAIAGSSQQPMLLCMIPWKSLSSMTLIHCFDSHTSSSGASSTSLITTLSYPSRMLTFWWMTDSLISLQTMLSVMMVNGTRSWTSLRSTPFPSLSHLSHLFAIGLADLKVVSCVHYLFDPITTYSLCCLGQELSSSVHPCLHKFTFTNLGEDNCLERTKTPVRD